MITVLALIKRLPALDRSAFRDHYENRHVAVAAPLLRHLVRYARHHVEEELHGPVDFDVVTSFGYPDKPALDGMFATLASDAALPILEDERRFMDKPANRFFETSERIWQAGEEGDRSIFVFVGRPPDMSRTECARSLLRDHWPALIEGVPVLGQAIVRYDAPVVLSIILAPKNAEPGSSSVLSLEPYYTAGPEESLFLDGDGRVLDPDLVFLVKQPPGDLLESELRVDQFTVADAPGKHRDMLPFGVIEPHVEALGFSTIWQAPNHYDHMHIDISSSGAIGGAGVDGWKVGRVCG